MAVEVLIHAIDHAKAVKGTPQVARDGSKLLSHPWGLRETLPNFIVLRIQDGSEATMAPFLIPWNNDVEFTVVNDNATRRRWRLNVRPNTVARFGSNKGVTDEMINHLTRNHRATVVSRAPDKSQGVIDVPLSDFDAIEADILDRFEESLEPRRFRFASADVDTVIAAGGRLTVISTDVIPGIIDRRA